MAVVSVASAEQTLRESLQMPELGTPPRLEVEDAPDPDRKLSLFVPLDPFQATLVEYEEAPTFLNTSRTKFICRPPFDGRRPPRFTFYFPNDDRTLANREMFISVVSENEPFECDTTSIWTVHAMEGPGVPLASGPMVRQGERSITILDTVRATEVKFCWPSSRIRLERSAPFRTGVGDDEVLLGQCPSGLLSPIGIRYGLPDCLSARLSYMLHIRRVGSDDTPAYVVIAQRQYAITNASDINFPRVRHIMIASDTLTASVDGHPTRSFQAETQERTPVVRPLFSLHETMATIAARSTHIITELVPTGRECSVVATLALVPTLVGQMAPITFEVWLPADAARSLVVQPAPVQVHVENGTPFFDDVTDTHFWQQYQDEASAPWTRISLPNTNTRISAQCINAQSRRESYQVSISVINHFTKPMLLAVPVYPDRFDVCGQIEAVSGARQIFDFPWKSSARDAEWALFVLNNRHEPISFRATVRSSGGK